MQCRHYYIRKRRDPGKRRSKLYWKIKAYQTHIKDLCMTPRQSRIAWDDRRARIEPQHSRSQLMKYHLPIWSRYLKRKMESKKR
jgi:hypothetical protein